MLVQYILVSDSCSGMNLGFSINCNFGQSLVQREQLVIINRMSRKLMAVAEEKCVGWCQAECQNVASHIWRTQRDITYFYCIEDLQGPACLLRSARGSEFLFWIAVLAQIEQPKCHTLLKGKILRIWHDMYIPRTLIPSGIPDMNSEDVLRKYHS